MNSKRRENEETRKIKALSRKRATPTRRDEENVQSKISKNERRKERKTCGLYARQCL